MAFRSDELSQEFKQSIIEHAVASGRDANCFFQSFFHILTDQNTDVLNAIKRNYKNSINALVDTFNKNLSLEPTIDFDKIMQISKELHPLERECVFGPILRKTYNTMLKNSLLSGERELPLTPDAIVMQPETVAFSKAFGAEIFSYMDQEEFKKSIKGMPIDVAERISLTEFKIGDKSFYCDHVPQELAGEKIFNINIVYAGMHLNYTLGESKRNNEHRNLIVTQVSELGGIFACRATNEVDAPLTKESLSFAEIINGLCDRFHLTRSEKIEMKENTKAKRAHTVTLFEPPKKLASNKTSNADSTVDETTDESVKNKWF